MILTVFRTTLNQIKNHRYLNVLICSKRKTPSPEVERSAKLLSNIETIIMKNTKYLFTQSICFCTVK